MGVYKILGNKSNSDYITQIIKIKEYCISELTMWEAPGLAAGVLSRELLHGKDSHAKMPLYLWEAPHFCPFLRILTISLSS